MLDFSNVKWNVNITSATLQMSSVQSPDNWEWFRTPTKPAIPTLVSLGTAFRTGTTTPRNDEKAYDILPRLNSGSNFISIHEQFNSSSGNLLLGQLILNAVSKTPARHQFADGRFPGRPHLAAPPRRPPRPNQIRKQSVCEAPSEAALPTSSLVHWSGSLLSPGA